MPNKTTSTGTPAPTLPPLYTYKELQARYKKSRATLERWVRSGKIKAIKVGGSVMFTHAAVLDFDATHEAWTPDHGGEVNDR